MIALSASSALAMRMFSRNCRNDTIPATAKGRYHWLPEFHGSRTIADNVKDASCHSQDGALMKIWMKRTTEKTARAMNRYCMVVPFYLVRLEVEI